MLWKEVSFAIVCVGIVERYLSKLKNVELTGEQESFSIESIHLSQYKLIFFYYSLFI
jgi:hypothetical protein